MTISTSIYAAARTTKALIKTYLGGDSKLDKEPKHSDVYDYDAATHNTMVASIAEVAARTRKGNLVTYHFSVANALDTQTAASLLRGTSGLADLKEVVALWDGSVVGLAVHVEGARSAGTLTVNVEIGGTPATIEAVIDDDPVQYTRAQQLPGIDTFSSLDLLEVTYTTDAAWAAGATPTLSVDLVVSYGEEEEI